MGWRGSLRIGRKVLVVSRSVDVTLLLFPPEHAVAHPTGRHSGSYRSADGLPPGSCTGLQASPGNTARLAWRPLLSADCRALHDEDSDGVDTEMTCITAVACTALARSMSRWT